MIKIEKLKFDDYGRITVISDPDLLDLISGGGGRDSQEKDSDETPDPGTDIACGSGDSNFCPEIELNMKC